MYKFVNKTSRLVRISPLISALNKLESFAFLSGKLFHRSNKKLFYMRLHILIYTLEGLGEFSTVMQTLDLVSGLHNHHELSQVLWCLYQAM